VVVSGEPIRDGVHDTDAQDGAQAAAKSVLLIKGRPQPRHAYTSHLLKEPAWDHNSFW
jgi:hypothetical protein